MTDDLIPLTRYQRYVLWAFHEVGADIQSLKKFLKETHWVGVSVDDEKIQRTLEELHKTGFIDDDPDVKE